MSLTMPLNVVRRVVPHHVSRCSGQRDTDVLPRGVGRCNSIGSVFLLLIASLSRRGATSESLQIRLNGSVVSATDAFTDLRCVGSIFFPLDAIRITGWRVNHDELEFFMEFPLSCDDPSQPTGSAQWRLRHDNNTDQLQGTAHNFINQRAKTLRRRPEGYVSDKRYDETISAAALRVDRREHALHQQQASTSVIIGVKSFFTGMFAAQLAALFTNPIGRLLRAFMIPI